MEKIKTIVDREPISSDYIEAKQDFGHVLSQVKNLKPPMWKSAWFYGPIGMAVVAVIVSVTSVDPNFDRPVEHASVVLRAELIDDLKQIEAPIVTQVASSHEPAPAILISKPAPAPEIIHEAPLIEETIVVEEPIAPEPVAIKRTPVHKEEAVKPRSKNMLPHFGTYYYGDIPVTQLSENTLECNDEVDVVAFKIHYSTQHGTETKSIVGNKIPKDVLDDIKRYNLGYMVFITGIKGLTANGKVVSLTSLNFIATN